MRVSDRLYKITDEVVRESTSNGDGGFPVLYGKGPMSTPSGVVKPVVRVRDVCSRINVGSRGPRVNVVIQLRQEEVTPSILCEKFLYVQL